ncbi:hypothetical protein HA48_19030 [Pantoea wallisii]|uniref:Uncharacterized protein n=1 Tax=Pantoea wallisii TaxID=1076551 RepID=A0A1X1CZC0_9GAMM|nr:hypothetical protein [Pantoea wallisii]ORM69680.1 hypothetical protein HA48_19030 [Pantoea wallisii]
MENSLISPYVTERIRRFDGTLIGVCHSAPFMLSAQRDNRCVNDSDIISLQDQLPKPADLIVVPVTGNTLTHVLQCIENYSVLQKENVRLAINYASLQQGGTVLRDAAQHFSFWLYDIAPPGMEWKNMADFPFDGIVLTDEFFSDNYLKFSFPFLLASLREREAEIILRTPQLALPEHSYSDLQLTGWQQQRTSSQLLEG